MKFGSSKTVNSYGDDGEVADISQVHESENVGNYKQFKVKHLVHNNQERILVITRFVNDMDEKRTSGLLTEITDEPSTRPQFIFKYPRTDIDGSYVVFTSWTEKI